MLVRGFLEPQQYKQGSEETQGVLTDLLPEVLGTCNFKVLYW